MSYYFTILSPTDVPLFSQAFGTSKAGGDGVARFRYPENARYMNQFIVHAALDIVDEVQWTNGAMYLKHIDTYPPASAYVSAFLTGTGVRFLLLHQPPGAPTATSILPSSASSSSASSFFSSATTLGSSGSSSPFAAAASRASSSSIANNPTSPQTEEAVRQFMNEVYENWVKTVMNPFYHRGAEITSPVFRSRVLAAARKWL
ncbi:hypothetical protein VTO42DRAFT_6255 [Malbranchea cinnamomea]